MLPVLRGVVTQSLVQSPLDQPVAIMLPTPGHKVLGFFESPSGAVSSRLSTPPRQHLRSTSTHPRQPKNEFGAGSCTHNALRQATSQPTRASHLIELVTKLFGKLPLSRLAPKLVQSLGHLRLCRLSLREIVSPESMWLPLRLLEPQKQFAEGGVLPYLTFARCRLNDTQSPQRANQCLSKPMHANQW